MRGTGWLSSDLLLLPAWVGSLFFAFLLGLGILFFPKINEKLRRFFFPLLLFPSVVVAFAFMLRGFEPLDRPIMHWIFHKEVRDSLRIGFVLDPFALIMTLVFGLALLAICLRNRPRVQVVSALSLSWVSLSIVASSKTFWTAALGLGIGMIAKFLPILFDHEKPGFRGESLDVLWMTSSKRSWIGLLVTLVGAAGLASHGLHLDFLTEGSWAALFESSGPVIAGSLFLGGLLIQFVPVITSAVLHRDWEGYLEEENFIFETAGGWVSVFIFYRILPNLRDTPWALGIEVAALVFMALSLFSLAFLESKRGAISFWLANLPLLVLTVLPSLQSRTAFLFVAGSVAAFSGLLLCLDHLRSRADLGLAVFFFLGSFGCVGWSTSPGIAEFLTKIEEQPLLGGAVLLIWLLFAAFGFRIVLRGGDSGPRETNLPKWLAAGFLILLGFGPILSGRWGAGEFPDMAEWIQSLVTESASMSWIGFGLSQSISVAAVLLGIFAASAAPLFPFAGKYPKGLAAARGLFGGVWIHERWTRVLSGAGEFWAERVSSRVWEEILPRSFGFAFSRLRRFGEFMEERVDVLTSSRFARIFTAPSKLVQWFHGGNVRLYAWFALGWILIISVYLTR